MNRFCLWCFKVNCLHIVCVFANETEAHLLERFKLWLGIFRIASITNRRPIGNYYEWLVANDNKQIKCGSNSKQPNNVKIIERKKSRSCAESVQNSKHSRNRSSIRLVCTNSLHKLSSLLRNYHSFSESCSAFDLNNLYSSIQ